MLFLKRANRRTLLQVTALSFTLQKRRFKTFLKLFLFIITPTLALISKFVPDILLDSGLIFFFANLIYVVHFLITKLLELVDLIIILDKCLSYI